MTPSTDSASFNKVAVVIKITGSWALFDEMKKRFAELAIGNKTTTYPGK